MSYHIKRKNICDCKFKCNKKTCHSRKTCNEHDYPGHFSSIGKIKKKNITCNKLNYYLGYKPNVIMCPYPVYYPVYCYKEFSAGFDNKEVEMLYKCFIEPFLKKSPLAIGSNDKANMLFESINSELEKTQSDFCKTILLIFRDLLSIIFCAQHAILEEKLCEREKEHLQKKLKLSFKTIDKLNEKICELEEIINPNKNSSNSGISGTLNVKSTKFKSILYLVARLDIEKAWYIYLFKSQKIEMNNLNSVINYLSQYTKEEAYKKLIEKLDLENNY